MSDNQNIFKELGFIEINLDPGFERRMGEVGLLVASSEKATELVREWLNELVYISHADKDMGEDRMSFLAEDYKKRVVEIGEEVNECGGLPLMQLIHTTGRELFKHPVDARILEFAWDGVGDWLC